MREATSGLIELIKDVREADFARLGFAVFLVVSCAGYVLGQLPGLLARVPATEWFEVGLAAFFCVKGMAMVAKTVTQGRADRSARLQADREANEEIRRLASLSRQTGSPPTLESGEPSGE